MAVRVSLCIPGVFVPAPRAARVADARLRVRACALCLSFIVVDYGWFVCVGCVVRIVRAARFACLRCVFGVVCVLLLCVRCLFVCGVCLCGVCCLAQFALVVLWRI